MEMTKKAKKQHERNFFLRKEQPDGFSLVLKSVLSSVCVSSKLWDMRRSKTVARSSRPVKL